MEEHTRSHVYDPIGRVYELEVDGLQGRPHDQVDDVRGQKVPAHGIGGLLLRFSWKVQKSIRSAALRSDANLPVWRWCSRRRSSTEWRRRSGRGGPIEYVTIPMLITHHPTLSTHCSAFSTQQEAHTYIYTPLSAHTLLLSPFHLGVPPV